jgi:cardiolipin synthase
MAYLGQGIILIFVVIQYILAFGIIFFERRNPNSALGWILVLLVLPIAGFFLYLFFGQNWTRRRLFSLKAADDRKIEEAVIAQEKELKQFAIETGDPQTEHYVSIIRMFLENNRSLLTTENELTIFTDGTETFESLLESIRNARHHVHLQYYIIRDDPSGKEVIRLLTQVAKRGVDVRLLYDGLGMKIRKKHLQEFEEAGGRHAAFFPRIFTINYRNHRKIAVIDGKTGYIGGYNIGDEYLGKGPLGYWRDAALKIDGPGVGGLQLRFLLDWNYAASDSLSYSSMFFPDVRGSGYCPLQVISSGPDARWNQIKEGYLKLVNSATQSIYIQTPYFIPDDSISDALRIAALSGVDVRIMIPCKPDHPFVHWATLSFVGDLLEAGVRAYTYDTGFLHAKTVVVDGLAASVGSANWDVRSFRLNFEANAFLYSAENAQKLKQAFLDDLPRCTEITPQIYQERGRWIRAKEQVSRLFSPLG